MEYYSLSVEVAVPLAHWRCCQEYLGAQRSLVNLQVGHLRYWGLGIVSFSFSLNSSILLSSRSFPFHPSGNPLSVIANRVHDLEVQMRLLYNEI